MILVLLVMSCLLTLWVAWVRGPLWPGTILGVTSCVHLIFFWVTGVLGIVPSSLSHWWHYKQPVESNAIYVVSIYFLQCCIGFSTIVIPRRSSGLQISDRDVSPRINAIADSVLILFACGFLSVAVFHAATVDWSVLFRYDVYLSVRDPDVVGIRFMPLRIFHKVAIQVAFVMFSGMYLLKKRSSMTLFLVYLCAIYGFVLSVSNLSRFCSVFPIVIALQSLGIKSTLFRRLAFVGSLIVGLVLYANSISMRLNSSLIGEDLVGEFGLGPSGSSLARLSFINEPTFTVSLISLSGSGFQLSHAFDHLNTYSIPLSRKLVSFSPLPSAIDNYAESDEKSYYARPQKSGPYSSMGESIVFGMPWVFGMAAVLFVITLASSDLVRSLRSGQAAICIATIYSAAIVIFQTYQIRNCIRLFWILALVWIVVRIVGLVRARHNAF